MKEDKNLATILSDQSWLASFIQKFRLNSTYQRREERSSQISKLIDQFDWDSKYGPYSGMTREDRYNRAVVNGLQPPPEIKNYLSTKPHPYTQFYKLC